MSSIIVAPDKFKGSLTATQVADAIRRGIREADPTADVVCVPVADGGDGTLDAAVAAGFHLVPVEASGPTGERLRSAYARRGTTAVVELAAVAGLVRLPGGLPAPLTASSRGVGEVLAAAVDDGCRSIVLGLGGSASTDGGAGLLQALGARVLDAEGRDLPSGGAALSDAHRLDLSALDRMRDVEVLLACDVDNPLLGAQGAAAVYGPQKGAGPADVIRLDRALAQWADLVAATVGSDLRDLPGAGAAGGVGFAALAVLGARMRQGIDVVLELVDLPSLLAGTALVVTGEGALDEQTLRGKAPLGVARAAAAYGVPVVAVCGRNTLSRDRWTRAGFDRVHALTDLEPDPDRCLAEAEALLTRTGLRIAGERLVHSPPTRGQEIP